MPKVTEYQPGDRIYYTGDQANVPSEGIITKLVPATQYSPFGYNIHLDNRHEFKIVSPLSFEKSPGRRFWLLSEWKSKREEEIKAFQERYKKVSNPNRPPKKWWDMMFAKISHDYPRKRSESLAHYRNAMAKITGGIWANYTQDTKNKVTSEYDIINNNQLKLVNPLPCPVCGTMTPVNRSGLRMRCQGCGRSLISVKVKRK